MDKVQELKKKLQKEGRQGLALDIDDTLAQSHEHWFGGMHKFHAPSGMTKEDVMRRYRTIKDVREWQTEKAFKHLEYLLYSDEFHRDIRLIAGADKAVKKLHKIVPVVAYVTARPQSVIAGTRSWLARHVFPEAELIVRIEKKDIKKDEPHRHKWKAVVLKDLYPEVLGIVDDKANLARELQVLGYKGTLFLYGKECEEIEGSSNVILCPTWLDVLKAVKKQF